MLYVMLIILVQTEGCRHEPAEERDSTTQRDALQHVFICVLNTWGPPGLGQECAPWTHATYH